MVAKFKVAPSKGGIDLYKESANTNITDNNNCYDLSHAWYGIYNSENEAKSGSNEIVRIETNRYETENGVPYWYANTANNAFQLNKEYWVKEVVAPQGYALDGNVYTVTPTVANGYTTVKKMYLIYTH